jgi:hypothetical protein
MRELAVIGHQNARAPHSQPALHVIGVLFEIHVVTTH